MIQEYWLWNVKKKVFSSPVSIGEVVSVKRHAKTIEVELI